MKIVDIGPDGQWRFQAYVMWNDVFVRLGSQRGWVLRAGWGFDEDLPLRPWPAVQHQVLKKAIDVCFAWCGFYFGVSVWAPGAIINIVRNNSEGV